MSLPICADGTIHFATGQSFPATSSSGVALSGTSNSGTGVQGTSSSATGVAGSSNSGDGMLGYTGGGTLNTAGVLGVAGGSSGFGGIAGVWGDAYNHVGVLGSSAGYAGVQGISTNGPGVQGSSTNSWGGRFSNSSASATVYATNTSSSGGAALYGASQGANGIGLYAIATSSGGTGVQAYGDGNAVSGSSAGDVLNTAGVLGIAGSRTGVNGIAGVWGDAQEHVGVIGSSKDYVGVYGASTNSYGIQGTAVNQVGVYGVGGSSATNYASALCCAKVGVWGDTTGVSGHNEGMAVVGDASDSVAAVFSNNSSLPTLIAYNNGSGSSSDDGMFRALEASTATGTCGVGDGGNFACTGQMMSLAATGNGAHMVETYSMQSPENWMEDFGSGTLKSASSTVEIDPAFAAIVTMTGGYHVFLTPNGDSKGLYIAWKSETRFEVRESAGGTASIGFDYRVVAKRRGMETQRMTDVTEAMKAVNIRNAVRAERATHMTADKR